MIFYNNGKIEETKNRLTPTPIIVDTFPWSQCDQKLTSDGLKNVYSLWNHLTVQTVNVFMYWYACIDNNNESFRIKNRTIKTTFKANDLCRIDTTFLQAHACVHMCDESVISNSLILHHHALKLSLPEFRSKWKKAFSFGIYHEIRHIHTQCTLCYRHSWNMFGSNSYVLRSDDDDDIWKEKYLNNRQNCGVYVCVFFSVKEWSERKGNEIPKTPTETERKMEIRKQYRKT